MLRATLICVGRLKAGPERELTERYMARASAAGRALGFGLIAHELPESKARRAADRMAEEAIAIRGQAQGPLVLFDERGRGLTSPAFAEMIRGAIAAGTSDMTFVIGGPDGLDPGLRSEAAQVIALGPMTWPHQIVRALVAEQLYRATTILSGHPYHRV